MPALRFLNPHLQERFVRALSDGGFAQSIGSNGMVVCTDAQWSDVNSIAHRIRDSCYPWYFCWFETTAAAREFEARLRSHGFRFEIEDHGDRLVFLLPKEDEGKHQLEEMAEPLAHETCSFCGKSYTNVEHLFTSTSAAICDTCVARLHEELSDNDPQSTDA